MFGTDYPTADGSGVRDYIHVMDLARGHVAALRVLSTLEGAMPINLGTGQGYSVLDMVKTMSEVVGIPLSYSVTARRMGDIACCYADATLAFELLGWKSEFGLDVMCRDGWAWQSSR